MSDDRHRFGQELKATEMMATKKKEILQADSDTKKKKVTNKHHQRNRTSGYKYRIIGMDECKRVWRPYFVMGSCDAQCARRDDEEPMIRRVQAVEQQLQEGDA